MRPVPLFIVFIAAIVFAVVAIFDIDWWPRLPAICNASATAAAETAAARLACGHHH